MEIRAKKSLGQHFLASPSALAKIIDAANIKSGETILEIGPGTGVLTEALLQTGAQVIAVEKDSRAITGLNERFAEHVEKGALKIIEADILETEASGLGLTDKNYALVANIPYYITGAILERFLEHAPRPNRMVLLVQKEVAERIAARDGKESILSISVKAFGEPRIVAKVPRGAFNPPPNVDSAILAIENISDARFTEKGLEIRRFFEILKAGFAHKRKFLKNNLAGIVSDFKLDEKIRAEDLKVEDWLELAIYYRLEP